MFSILTQTQKGILIAFAGFTSFALADACSKWLGMRYETQFILYWVYYISLIIGLVCSPFLGGVKKTLQTKRLHIHIWRGVCALGIAITVVSALSKGLPLATLYTILFLAPFLITITAIPIYKEPVTVKSWLIIALGFSGILIAFRGGVEFSIASAYAFSALGFIVVLSLLARPLCHKETLLSLSFYPNIVILSMLTLPMLPNLSLPDMRDIPIFLLDGLFVTIGLSAIAYGFRIAPYSIIAPIHYTQMVIAVIVGYIVFGDVPDIWLIFGASIIIISGIMLALNKDNKKH